MKGTKYLSEAIHMDEIKPGVLNLICAPTGAGKTTWAMEQMVRTISDPYKMVYLIDTVNGKQQLLNHPRARHYDDFWRAAANDDEGVIDGLWEKDKIVVMTYAKFGKLVSQCPKFGSEFELILCDEIHNLPRFSAFISKNPEDEPLHKIAKARIEEIVREGKTIIIGLSATPERAEKFMQCPNRRITVDADVRRFETRQLFSYRSLQLVVSEISPQKRGILYVGRITMMEKICAYAQECGISAIAVWSINNKDHMMTDEQRRVRTYILENQQLPPEYDLFIINASSETSINIFTPLDYMIIHCQQRDVQIQVRGRLRRDLDRLYVLDDTVEIAVPDEYMNVRLFTEEKEQLAALLEIRNEKNELMKWRGTAARLRAQGFVITDGRENGRRFSVIAKEAG